MGNMRIFFDLEQWFRNVLQMFYSILVPLSMESQPQNPEFRNNPENIHP